MSMRSFESEILQEARRITGKRTLRQSDIMEWSTNRKKVENGLRTGEKFFHLPENNVYVALVGVK